MIDYGLNNQFRRPNRSGFVLLVTLVLLVVISALGYVLAGRVADQRYRSQYLIDYQTARYACDSAVKYALAAVEDINAPLVSRPNEPDFSDLFHLSEQEYEKLLADWAAGKFSQKNNKKPDVNDANDSKDANAPKDFNSVRDANVIKNVPKDVNIAKDINVPHKGSGDFNEPNDPNSLFIRGPYGPPWPFVIKPVEFKIGTASVRIEIEDENAKFPLGWAMLNDQSVQDESAASFETFCGWMGLDPSEIDSLREDLEKIRAIKPFKMKFDTVFENKPTKTRVIGRAGKPRTGTITMAVAPASVHISDFVKIFHSSLVNIDLLARPTILSTARKESALKYMDTWASSLVNVNTAPRNVLEAAFTFGGDAPKVADLIIQQRRIKPFENIDGLRKILFRYADSIKKSEKYITTYSSFFTIKVTATNGLSTVSSVIAVVKNGNKIDKVAIISG
jgi:hypothetical protein